MAPTVRQVSVQFGTAAEVAADLTALLQLLSEVNGRRAAEVSAVEALNALLLTGSPDAVAEAEALLARVDLPEAGAQTVRTVPVDGVMDPEQLVEDAQELFEILSTGANAADASITATYKEDAAVVVLSGSSSAVQPHGRGHGSGPCGPSRSGCATGGRDPAWRRRRGGRTVARGGLTNTPKIPGSRSAPWIFQCCRSPMSWC